MGKCTVHRAVSVPQILTSIVLEAGPFLTSSTAIVTSVKGMTTPSTGTPVTDFAITVPVNTADAHLNADS